jgi:hypothetical protein
MPAPERTRIESSVRAKRDAEGPKAKFLTVVWGKAYIDRFCSLALPSYLSPGNIPALAEAVDLEVVVMTPRQDIEHFRKNASFRRLETICEVRFIEIDDLLATAVYGVTLTLAYARPIIACGEEMLRTHFIFMNADFVLADGALRALCEHIRSGRSIVLAPSFRAIAEDLEPMLRRLVNRGAATLRVEPRRLAEISLARPHRTTVAKTFNQRVFYSTHPNQFFWQVDQSTVLGRYFLIFHLCLKPERIMRNVSGYADYSFIPELCPSGDEVVMGDSDKFFMLELQKREQETNLLRFGEMSPRRIARTLSEWTTAEHRRASRYDIVFHSRDLPASLGAAKVRAEAFVEDIQRRLTQPKSHLEHRYWVNGVEAWKGYRLKKHAGKSVPELAPYRVGWEVIYRRLRSRTKQVLYGVKQSVFDADAADRWLFQRTLQTILREVPLEEVLILGERDELLRGSIDSDEKMTSMSFADVLRDNGRHLREHSKEHKVSAILVNTKPGNVLQAEADQIRAARRYQRSAARDDAGARHYDEELRCSLEHCVSIADTKSVVCLFFKQSDGDISQRLLALSDLLEGQAEAWSVRSAGGPVSWFARRLLARCVGFFRRQFAVFGRVSRLWTIWPLVAAYMVMGGGNLCSRLSRPSRVAARCSSAVIFTKLWETRDPAQSSRTKLRPSAARRYKRRRHSGMTPWRMT